MIHEDIGYHCEYALINASKRHYPISYVLSDGDQVILFKSNDIHPEYYWFRHVKTEKAINYLIDYFKRTNPTT